MVTQITLGNIFQQNGRTVVGGSQSGIDTEALINGLVEARRLPAVRLEGKNETLDAQKAALNSLKSLMTRFRTAMDSLRNPPGVQNASQNIFQYRTASLSSVVTASNYLGVTVEPGANVQSLTIDEITQLARASKQETGVFSLASATSAAVLASGDATAGRLSAGSFSLRVLDGGAAASITLAEGDSLQTVASKFNAVKDRTGIQATVVKVANGSPNSDFKLIFTGTQTGTTGAFDLESALTVTSDPDGALGDVVFSNINGETAQNAIFKLNGVTITRESNVIDDLIDGITFTLKQELDDATPITLSIEPDTEIVTNAINTFADVYNEFRVFAAKQQAVGDDGLPTEDAVLYNSTALRSLMTAIGTEMTRAIEGISGGNPKVLSDIGIKLQDFEGDEETPKTRNIIVIDAETLKSSLLANFDGVRGLFEYSMTSSNSNLVTFSRTNALNVTSFNLVIDRTNGVYEARDPDDNSLIGTFTGTAQTTGGIVLKGATGSPLEGLELIYGVAGDATMSVNLSQGIGDRLFNLIDDVLDTSDGSLVNAIDTIETQATRNKEEIAKIDTNLETYRDRLVEQYASLESALTKANQLLQLLDAQSAAREANA